MLVQYVTKSTKKKGVMVAIPINSAVRFGWAMCHRRDKFNRELGKKIAMGRALCENKNYDLPASMKRDFKKFVNRAERYYKDKKIISNVVIN